MSSFFPYAFTTTLSHLFLNLRQLKLDKIIRIKANTNSISFLFLCCILVTQILVKIDPLSSSAYEKNFVGGAEHNLPE